MSKLIAPADDEVVERVFGEQGRRAPLANSCRAAGKAHGEWEQLLLGRCRCLNEHAGWRADGLGEYLLDDTQITVAHQVDGELIWSLHEQITITRCHRPQAANEGFIVVVLDAPA